MLDFHLIVWPTVLLGGVQIAYVYSIGTMMKNLGLEEFSTTLLTVYFLSNAIIRIPVFIFIDRFFNKSLFLVIAGPSMSMSLILCLSFGDNIVIFAITITLCAVTGSCSWAAGPALISEHFGNRYFV